MRHEVRSTGKRPRDAYTDMIVSVPKKFKSSATQSNIVLQLPSYHEVRCQLSRHRSHTCIPVPDPQCLPESLKSTLRGREADADDPLKDERFLLHSGQEERLLLFCANTELRYLFNSDYIICDGTFQMARDTSYQVYTLHGYVNGESLALAWCLLPNKTQQSYTEMFGALADAFVRTYGEVGQRTFLTDFGSAAINAIRCTFPASVVKGCTFHFRQAITRRLQAVSYKLSNSVPLESLLKLKLKTNLYSVVKYMCRLSANVSKSCFAAQFYGEILQLDGICNIVHVYTHMQPCRRAKVIVTSRNPFKTALATFKPHIPLY